MISSPNEVDGVGVIRTQDSQTNEERLHLKGCLVVGDAAQLVCVRDLPDGTEGPIAEGLDALHHRVSLGVLLHSRRRVLPPGVVGIRIDVVGKVVEVLEGVPELYY